MKSEKLVLFMCMVLNFIVALIKLFVGIVFQFSSLIADSLHSFSDFITDIIAYFANRIGKKRANKRYPFGYGMIENISNLIIGFILFMLGFFILYQGFHSKEITLQPILFVILIITLLLKLFVVWILYSKGKNLNSNNLMVSAKESLTDFVSSCVVFVVSVLLLFKEEFPIFAYADIVGSIVISLIVFHIAFKIIIENVEYLLGKSVEDTDVIDRIRDILARHKVIKDNEIKLLKFGTYYALYLTLELSDEITLKQLFRLDKSLKKEIKKEKIKVKFIQIEPREYVSCKVKK